MDNIDSQSEQSQQSSGAVLPPQQQAVSIKKKPKFKIIVLISLALLLLGAAGFIAVKMIQKKSTSQTTAVATAVSPAEVTISADGFSPTTVLVKKGQSVDWTNQDADMHQIAADPYPTHSSLPELLSDPLNKGESYSFRFETAGTYTYHDELNPLKFSATVIVK